MHVWRGQPARCGFSTESCALHVCMYDLGELGEVMSEVTEQSQKPPEAISEHVGFKKFPGGHAPRPLYIVIFHIPSLYLSITKILDTSLRPPLVQKFLNEAMHC